MQVVKVSEVSGVVLDWLVAKCIGRLYKDQLLNGTTMYGWWISGLFVDPNYWICLNEFKPSGNWAQGGPIIDREHINLRPTFTEGGYRTSQSSDAVCAKIDLPNDSTVFDPLKVVQEYGPTPLIAAMRCYVASKLGETVEVPDELFKSIN